MNVYLFSDNIFFYTGVNSLIESEYGVSVKLVTIDFLQKNNDNGTINSDDIFIVASESFNVTMSILVMLDSLSTCNFLVNYDNSILKKLGGVDLFTPNKVDNDSIRSIMEFRSNLMIPKLWRLTSRESVVLSYRLTGKSVLKIGLLLKTNVKTIYAHQRNALNKMRVRTMGHFHML